MRGLSLLVLMGCVGEVSELPGHAAAETLPTASTAPSFAGTTAFEAEPEPAAPPGCPPNASFCEDFEDGLDLTRWKQSHPTAVSLDATHAHRGTHALHVKVGDAYALPAPQTLQMIRGVHTPDDHLWLRVWLRFEQLRLPGYHPNLISVTSGDYDVGRWPEFARLSFGTFLGELSVNGFGKGLDGAKLWTEPSNHYTDPAGDDTPLTEHALAAGEWFCLEMHVFGDHQGPGDTSHPNEENRVFINGVEVPELYGSDARWGPWGAAEHWSPDYDGSLWAFGIDGAYTSGPTQDLWFDSIAFGNTRLGCGE